MNNFNINFNYNSISSKQEFGALSSEDRDKHGPRYFYNVSSRRLVPVTAFKQFVPRYRYNNIKADGKAVYYVHYFLHEIFDQEYKTVIRRKIVSGIAFEINWEQAETVSAAKARLRVYQHTKPVTQVNWSKQHNYHITLCAIRERWIHENIMEIIGAIQVVLCGKFSTLDEVMRFEIHDHMRRIVKRAFHFSEFSQVNIY